MNYFWQRIKQSKGRIIVLTLASAVLGYYVASTQPPRYEAKATLQIAPIPDGVTSSMGSPYSAIRSQMVSRQVVHQLNLVEYFKNKATKAKKVKYDSAYDLQWLQRKAKELLVSLSDSDSFAKLSDQHIETMLVQTLSQELQVTHESGGRLIKVLYQSNDAKQASDIVNAFVQAFINQQKVLHQQQLRGLSEELEMHALRIKGELNSKFNRLESYKFSLGKTELTQQDSIATEQKRLTSELQQVQEQVTKTTELYQQAQGIDPSTDVNDYPARLRSNSTLRELHRMLSEENSKMAVLTKSHDYFHPDMIAAREAIKGAREDFERWIKDFISTTKSELTAATVHLEAMKNQLDDLQEDIMELQEHNKALGLLEHDVETSRHFYEQLLTRSATARSAALYPLSDIHVIDEAKRPVDPLPSPWPQLTLRFALLALLLSLLVVYLRMKLQCRFGSTWALEEALKLPTFGLIPRVEAGNGELSLGRSYIEATQKSAQTPLVEAINEVRTSLLFSNPVQSMQSMSVLVTSSTASEGRSALATSLAAAFAQLGNTLLIEVDQPTPTLAASFSLPLHSGLCELLAQNGYSLSEVTYKLGNYEQLSLMPCGNTLLNTAKTLASREFAELLESLKKEYSYIVIDAPPADAMGEALVLTTLVDEIIMTVKANSTHISRMKQAQTHLANLNLRPTGTVLVKM